MSIVISFSATENFTGDEARELTLCANDYVNFTYGNMTIDEDTYIASVNNEGIWTTDDGVEWSDLTISLKGIDD